MSYAHEDWEAAERLFTDLEGLGFNLWFDRRHFRPEEEVDAQVLNAIKESYYFLVLLSPVSVSKDGYVRKEIKLAFDLINGLSLSHSFIIPVRIAKCQPRPEEIGGLGHHIDMFPDWLQGIGQIAALVNDAAPTIEGVTAHDLQVSLSDLEYLRQATCGLKDRPAVSVFLANCVRQFNDVDADLVSRKIVNIRDNIGDFAACTELHFVEGCGTEDDCTQCLSCNAIGTIIHGVTDVGGFSLSDHNDNYVAWCTNCYWSFYSFEIDYHGTGPLKFDYLTNTYK